MAEIKLWLLKNSEGGERGMTSGQFHTQALESRAKPGPHHATLIKDCCSCPKGQKRGSLKYANLQDNYTLILL